MLLNINETEGELIQKALKEFTFFFESGMLAGLPTNVAHQPPHIEWAKTLVATANSISDRITEEKILGRANLQEKRDNSRYGSVEPADSGSTQEEIEYFLSNDPNAKKPLSVIRREIAMGEIPYPVIERQPYARPVNKPPHSYPTSGVADIAQEVEAPAVPIQKAESPVEENSVISCEQEVGPPPTDDVREASIHPGKRRRYNND